MDFLQLCSISIKTGDYLTNEIQLQPHDYVSCHYSQRPGAGRESYGCSCVDLGDVMAGHRCRYHFQVPSLQVSASFGEVQTIISIRSISMVDTNTNQASPIGVCVDEIAVGSALMQDMQTWSDCE